MVIFILLPIISQLFFANSEDSSIVITDFFEWLIGRSAHHWQVIGSPLPSLGEGLGVRARFMKAQSMPVQSIATYVNIDILTSCTST
jgi:hypothetical protein